MVESAACGGPLVLSAAAVLEKCLELEGELGDVLRALATPSDGRNQPDVHRSTGPETRTCRDVAAVLDPYPPIRVLLHDAADVSIDCEVDDLASEITGVRLDICPPSCEVDSDRNHYFHAFRHRTRQISDP